MNKYLLILGQSSALARQELAAVLSSSNGQIELTGTNFAVISANQTPQELINILGGTIKVGQYIQTIKNLSDLNTSLWYDILKNNLKPTSKNCFGFSLYNDSNNNYQNIKKVAFQLKKILREKKYKSRLVTGQEAVLSSVIVAKNKLLDHELLIIKNHEEYLLGITRTVQDFVSYGFRDMARPYRDNRSGMLPPKVARMLVNLAGYDTNKSLLDPFCGSGTILQEAMLLGYKKIYGSDISSQAVEETKQNLDWLSKNFALKADLKIKVIDVKNIDQNFETNSIDLIVSEPFMGDARFISQQRSSHNLLTIRKDLQNLYQTAFEKFQKILSPAGQIIFIFPVFNIAGQDIYTLDKKNISRLGFDYQLKEDIIYSREDQKVKRQITVWKFK